MSSHRRADNLAPQSPAQAGPALLLEVEELHFSYGDRPVLRGVDLTVRPGEVVGLVGPNGAGKSTFLRLVSGVLKPQRGAVRLGGADIASLSSWERAQLLAVVPQAPVLPASFTALELALMGRTPHLKLFQWEGERDLRLALKAMEETGTRHLADRRLEELSGGERQRLLIARALAQEAPLLLLDEPTANLDLAHQTGVLDLATRLQHERKGGMLLAIHDLTLAAQYCRRVAVLHEGRVFAQGAPWEVVTQEMIAQVYGARVVVVPHPTLGTPVVIPTAGR